MKVSDSHLAQEAKNVVMTHYHLYEKASAYTSVILGVGYISYFTAWANIYITHPNLILLLSFLFMLFSISIFIIHEIARMLIVAYSSGNAGGLLNSPLERYEDFLVEHISRLNTANSFILRIWFPQFLATSLSAILSGGLLVFWLVCQLLRI
jgi:hypothetical protein